MSRGRRLLDLTARGFHTLLGNSGRLILADRTTYVMQFGDVPFYSAPIVSERGSRDQWIFGTDAMYLW